MDGARRQATGRERHARIGWMQRWWSPPAPPGHSDLDTSNTAMFSEQAAQRAHTLLSPPAVTSATFARVPVAMYTNTSQPFRLGERSFSRQYAHIYATRLVQMRPFLVSQAQRHWGTVLAVLGSVREDGKFQVEDHCFAGLALQQPTPALDTDRFVLLVSGLGLGSGGGESLLGTQLLVDMMTGQLGDEGEQCSAAHISRVILAGNLLSHSTQGRDSINKAKYLTKKTQAASVEAVKMLDEILLQLSASVPVDVMPGEFDPTNYTLPQQPLHPCMFPLATAYSTLQLVTNPYQATIDGVRFLGTSGQNVRDIFRYSSMEDHVEILEWTLRVRHLSPTAPDTLGCYPFYKIDPFILLECPHVYFCGNTPSFGSRIFQGPEGQRVLLVAVPDFSTTQTACLVNLRSLACQPISFSGFGAEEEDLEGFSLGP
ncbi:DNA polymerase delta subunit 2 isoform X3 [Manis pentadactyla]|uniref:DNA polymerase delta subunit 2 isoform X3 n=1 Tax=Manis pentadactyla TaxID=143292 RepID=UPI001874E4A8|nr:DNA polymerase delta subunit 2 isoform X3 [Manis pentadactyla]